MVLHFKYNRAVILKLIERSVAMCFRRTESLRYSSYFEECRQSLAESDDHPNDVISAGMVKLQSILERIYHSPWNVRDNPSGSLPVVFFVSSIEEQLKRFREEFSAQLVDNSQSNTLKIDASFYQTNADDR